MNINLEVSKDDGIRIATALTVALQFSQQLQMRKYEIERVMELREDIINQLANQ